MRMEIYALGHSRVPRQNSASLKENWTGGRADENLKTGLRNVMLTNAIVEQITV